MLFAIVFVINSMARIVVPGLLVGVSILSGPPYYKNCVNSAFSINIITDTYIIKLSTLQSVGKNE